MERTDMMHIMYDKKGPAVARNFEKEDLPPGTVRPARKPLPKPFR